MATPVDEVGARLSSVHLGVSGASEPVPISGVTLESLAQQIATGQLKRIVVLTGAGISCSAGIPDFRSPGTGLYDNLQKYNLPHPTAVFELSYFRSNPKPFYLLAKELYPGGFVPTPVHFFIRALHEHQALLRCATQNIDGLELVAGLPAHKLVQAHGGFSSAACIDCKRPTSEAEVKAAIFSDRIPRCANAACGGLVKPSIVFFGESLPPAFFECVNRDLPAADLLIVMGTSLTVQPFASLIARVGPTVPRVLINMHAAGEESNEGSEKEEDDEEEILSQNPHWNELQRSLLKADPQQRPQIEAMLRPMRAQLLAAARIAPQSGFNFRRKGGRDLFVQGDCDSGVRKLAALIGKDFAKRLEQLIVEANQQHTQHTVNAGMTLNEVAAKVASAIAAAATTPDHATADAPTASQLASSSSHAACLPPLAIGFDFDHTLGRDNSLEVRALQAVAKELGHSQLADSDEFSAAMEPALRSFRDGHTTQQQLMQELQKVLPGEKYDVSTLQHEWQTHCFALSSHTESLPGAVSLLQWLRSEKIPYAILTNGWSPLQQKKIATALGGVAPSSECLLVSDEVGACKPDAAAFAALLRCPGFVGLPPSRVWYVGDNPKGDVGGALAAGLQAVFFDEGTQRYPSSQQPPPSYCIHHLDELRPILEAEIRKQKQTSDGLVARF